MSISQIHVPNNSVSVYNHKEEPRDLNTIGRTVEWIRESSSKGFVQKTGIYVVAVIIAVALIVTIVGIPVLIYASGESVRQQERAVYERKYKEIDVSSREQAKAEFKKGRLEPLKRINIHLHPLCRKKMLDALEIDQKEASTIRDDVLLKRIAIKYNDYMRRFELKISSER